MFGRIIDWYIDRKVSEQRKATPAIDWETLHDSIKKDIDGHAVFLEMRDGCFLPVDDCAVTAARADIVGLVVTQLLDGAPTWESEAPAQALAEILSARPGLSVIVQISRRLDSFVGYYVRVRPLLH